MQLSVGVVRRVAVTTVTLIVLASAVATALTASSAHATPAKPKRPTAITRRLVGYVTIPGQTTGTITVPYPDALEYGNARYSGHAVVVPPPRTAKGRRPVLGKVRIIEAQSVEGGSAYQARAFNDNRRGTAPVRLSATAVTFEPLPHR